MTEFNKIHKYIKDLYNQSNFTYKNYKYINEIKKYLLNINKTLTNKERYIFYNKLINFNIHYLYSDFFNELIKNTYFELLFDKNKNRIYDKKIHNYLYQKIYNIFDNTKFNINLLINNEKDNNIKNELLKIDNFINENNLLNNIKDIKILYFENNIQLNNIQLNNIQLNKIDIFKKISYPNKSTKFIEYDYEKDIIYLTSYQCYFKSSLNFFINNGEFIKQFINDKVIIKKPIHEYDIYDPSSDKIDSLKGGKYEDIYKTFQNIFLDIYNDKTEEYNLNNPLLILRELINKELNNKYNLGFPGFKIYPYYIIQDLLLLFNDSFTNNCLIKYNNNTYSYIYECNENCFLNDIINLHSYFGEYNNLYDNLYLDYNNIINYNNFDNGDYDIDYTLLNSNIIKIPFKYINNKYHYENNIINYITNIKNTPKNLLIACSIHDITSIYMLNNKIKLFNYDYFNIKNTIEFIKSLYDINIIYPFIINLNDKKYKLHSFIMVNNETLDSHFVYYKVNGKSLIRFDSNKKTLNNDNIKFKQSFIQEEFNNLYNDNFIKDNLGYKVIFCYYRLIN